MDLLTLFGLFAVTSMVVFYALEHRSRWFILSFAGACALASVYGFLQGAWPFGVVEVVWAFVAVWRWWGKKAVLGKTKSEQETEGSEDKEGPEEIVLNVIREKGKAKRADLLPHVGISKSSLVRLLDDMEKRGLVVQTGERKGAYYTLKVLGHKLITY